MGERRTWGSRLLVGAVLGGLAVALTACGGVLSPPNSSSSGVRSGVSRTTPSSGAIPSPRTSPKSALLPRSTPSAAPGSSTGAAVTVGLGDDGTTVVVGVGQELVVTLPNPSEREMTREMVKSSNFSVVELLAEDQPAGQFVAVLRVPFRALRVGTAMVTATGTVPFTVKIDVVAA